MSSSSSMKKLKQSVKKKTEGQENRKTFFDVLLEDSDIPDYCANVLQKDEFRRSASSLDQNEFDKFWTELHPFIVDKAKPILPETAQQEGDVKEHSVSIVTAATGLIKHCSTSDENFPDSFARALGFVNGLLHIISCTELQNEICQMSEVICKKQLRLSGSFYINTLSFLLDSTLEEERDITKVEMKRVWEMRVALYHLNLRSSACEHLVKKLNKVVICPTYLICKQGRQFIAFLITLDSKLLLKFHDVIKDFLPTTKRSLAAHYGEIYYTAWSNSTSDIRQVVEVKCIQNLMSHVFQLKRQGLEMGKLGQNVFAILSSLHDKRKLVQFSKTITELYTPLIWRYLRSGNNVERCNAAEVFLDIYPMEKPGSSQKEIMAFLERQHSEMADLLTDNCHIVRILAVKGICQKLRTSWDTYSKESVRVLIHILINDLANDGSSADVRRAVYQGLSTLIHCSEAAAFLQNILPSLGDHIHDENSKVRRSFVEMLIQIKMLPQPNPLRFWDIVTLHQLAVRLQREEKLVGEKISELMISSLIGPTVSKDNIISRICGFILSNPVAARNIFRFSRNSLKFDEAVQLILHILAVLRHNVKVKLSVNVTTQSEDTPSKKLKTDKRRGLSIQDSNVDEKKRKGSPQVDKPSEKTSKISLDNAVLSHGLIDIISLLWAVHSSKLNEPGNEGRLNDLHDLTADCIPLFLKFYKGTSTYYAVIHLASYVPVSKLTPVSTIVSASLSQLKAMSEAATPLLELEVLVDSLCAWNRSEQIMEVILEWFDESFRSERLNQSQTESQRRRKVRFQPSQNAKPLLALKLLDIIFSNPANKFRVLDKSYRQLFELYTYMERIKVLVERRVYLGIPLDNPVLSDEFLIKCLYRYAKLIVLLHCPEPTSKQWPEGKGMKAFCAPDVFSDFLVWSVTSIMAMLPHSVDEEPDISITLMQNIVRVGYNIIGINCVSNDCMIRLAEITKTLLDSECGLWFVESSLYLIKYMVEHTEAHDPEDEEKILHVVTPSLLSYVLRILSQRKYTATNILHCVKNMKNLKLSIISLPLCLNRLYGNRSSLLYDVVKLFVDCCVAVIEHDVRELYLLDTTDKVQELPYVASQLISVIISRPVLSTVWLSAFSDSICTSYSQNEVLLGSAVCLLHTLVNADIKLPRSELVTVVRTSHTAVTSFTNNQSMNHSESSQTTDLVKAATTILIDAAAQLKCSLQ